MAVVELTKENFEQVVTSNPTVVVDYWAPWCGPCRGFAPVFEKVSEQHPDVVSRLFDLGKADAAGGFPEYLLLQAESAEDAPGCSPFAAIR